MKIPRIANAVGHIDDELIAGADAYRRKKISPLLVWGPIAACLVLVAAGTALFRTWVGPGTTLKDNVLGPWSESGGRYRENCSIMSAETAIVWPHEYLTVSERYRNVEIDGVKYYCSGRPVSEELVGGSIGSYKVTGEYDGREYSAEFEAYTLRDIAQSQFVAVRMEDEFYVFHSDAYDPPATLGELLEEVHLPDLIELRHFSENGDGPDSSHFELQDDSYIWEVLAACGDAPFVGGEEAEEWDRVEMRNYLSFTVTSEAMAVYKSAMYVTEDGYLWTNIFGWQYLFDIGEDAANDIIRWAKENAREAEFETYMHWVAGTVTEITDDHVLIDDSVLCRDPEDGLTYMLPLDDLRISRYFKYGAVKAGDIVQVSYTGEIEGNTIGGAASINRVDITDDGVAIKE